MTCRGSGLEGGRGRQRVAATYSMFSRDSLSAGQGNAGSRISNARTCG